MAKNYELFINDEPFFLKTTGKYFTVWDEQISPKDLDILMLDEVYRYDEELYEELTSCEYEHIIVRQFTPLEIAEYIMSSYFFTYDPNLHEYSISYDRWKDKLNDTDFILDEDEIKVAVGVTYDAPYMNDENCERFFEETENIDNKNFMEVCSILAALLNFEIWDYQ